MNCKQTCMHYEWWNKSKSAWQGRRYPNLKNSSLNISTLLFKCHVLPLLQWRGCVSVIRTLSWRNQIRLNSFVKWSLTSIMEHFVLYCFWVVFSQRSCFLMSAFSQPFSIKCSITGYTSFKGFPDSTGTCSLCVFVLWRAHYAKRQAVMSTFPNSVQLYLASELIWHSHPLVFQTISFSYHFFPLISLPRR